MGLSKNILKSKEPLSCFQITLAQVTKSYASKYLFKEWSYVFADSSVYVLRGANGSGKSTLLQTVAGFLTPDQGQVLYKKNHRTIRREQFFRYQSFAAPYIPLLAYWTVTEMLRAYQTLRPLDTKATEALLLRYGLQEMRQVLVKDLSDGLLQRLKLLLALHTDAELLLLDEPTTALDKQGIALFQEELIRVADRKLIIMAAHHLQEYQFLPERQVIFLDFPLCPFN